MSLIVSRLHLDSRKNKSKSSRASSIDTLAKIDCSLRAHLARFHVASILRRAADTSNIYPYGTCRHIEINVDGRNFFGYNYSERYRFSSSVSGNSIRACDHRNRRHSNYVVLFPL